MTSSAIAKPEDVKFDLSKLTDKCEIRCANCHAIKTAKQRDYYNDIDLNKMILIKNENIQRRKNKLRSLIYLKTMGCIDCGKNSPLCLQYDHIDRSTKTDNVSNMLCNNSWDAIEEEINKCEVRCANCHRIKTAKAQNYYSKIDLEKL